jgi:hypothetical protein
MIVLSKKPHLYYASGLESVASQREVDPDGIPMRDLIKRLLLNFSLTPRVSHLPV